MKRIIELFIRDFTAILSSNVIFSSLFLAVFSIRTVDAAFMLQLIVLSFIATVFDAIYYVNGFIGSIPLIYKMIIHFILIYALFVFGGSTFKWFSLKDTHFLLSLSVFILIGYAAVFVVIYLNECKQAKMLNIKLNEYKSKRSDRIE